MRFAVASTKSLGAWREAAAHCTACSLWKNATQKVFGQGRRSAKVVLVGEQPGDREDIAGKPFVGPAGINPRYRVRDEPVDHCQSIHGASHRAVTRDRRGLTVQ